MLNIFKVPCRVPARYAAKQLFEIEVPHGPLKMTSVRNADFQAWLDFWICSIPLVLELGLGVPSSAADTMMMDWQGV
jgi:hypothetical protein